MSGFSATAFGLTQKSNVTCIGETPEAFKDCILSIQQDKNLWNELRVGGFSFIDQTHSRIKALNRLEKVISIAKNKYIERNAVHDPQRMLESAIK